LWADAPPLGGWEAAEQKTCGIWHCCPCSSDTKGQDKTEGVQRKELFQLNFYNYFLVI